MARTLNVVSLLLTLLLATSTAAQPASRSARIAQPPVPQIAQQQTATRIAVADLDGDGAADTVLADLDGDGSTDVVPLSRAGRHESVKNSIANVRREPAQELDVGDLDGDGRPELALLGNGARVRSLNDSGRSVLSVIRRELAAGQVTPVAALVEQGWLDPGATGGDPLAHVVGGGSGGSAPPPIPYPDPENNPNGSSSGGSGPIGSSGGSGGTISTTVGDEAGTLSGIVRPTRIPDGFVPNPG